jgi:DnaA regulatory inactivator Hda
VITTDQLILEFDHRPALTGEDFLVAPNNADAVAWIDRWPAWSSPVLCIVGPPGCGKSHLSEVLKSRSGAITMPVSHLSAPYQPPPASVIIIEDIDSNLSEEYEEGLFHLFNDISAEGGSLLLNASCPPSRWPIKLADLRSRMGTANVAEISPPDDALIAAVLVKLFQDRQLRISGDVITYAVSRMERSFAAARQIVAIADKLALSEKKRITVPLVKRVLEMIEHKGDG